jgi:hypothetical protein
MGRTQAGLRTGKGENVTPEVDAELTELRAKSAALAGRVNKGLNYVHALEDRGIDQDSPEYDRYFIPWEKLLREYEQVGTNIAALEAESECMTENSYA